MNYHKIEITSESSDKYLIQGILQKHHVNGWQEAERENRCVITLYIPKDKAGSAIFTKIKKDLKRIKTAVISKSVLKEEDWAQSWKENFQPQKIKNIIVRPPWKECETTADDKVIIIEPGMAFGTGDHATTALCIELLQTYVKPNMDILDLGTGSGILAITAQLLGANKIVGIDNDPIATKEAIKNLEAMGLSDKIEITTADATETIEGIYDIITANIFLMQLKMVLSDGCKPLKNGGFFIGSGLIKAQRKDIEQLLKENGFEILEILEKGIWIAVAAKKR